MSSPQDNNVPQQQREQPNTPQQVQVMASPVPHQQSDQVIPIPQSAQQTPQQQQQQHKGPNHRENYHNNNNHRGERNNYHNNNNNTNNTNNNYGNNTREYNPNRRRDYQNNNNNNTNNQNGSNNNNNTMNPPHVPMPSNNTVTAAAGSLPPTAGISQPLSITDIYTRVYHHYIPYIPIPTTTMYSAQWFHVFETLKSAYWQEIDNRHALSGYLQKQKYTGFVYNFFKHFEQYWPYVFQPTSNQPTQPHQKDGKPHKTLCILNYLLAAYKRQIRQQPVYGAILLNHSLSRILLVGHPAVNQENIVQPATTTTTTDANVTSPDQQDGTTPQQQQKQQDEENVIDSMNSPTNTNNNNTPFDPTELTFTPPRGKSQQYNTLLPQDDPVEITIREVRDTTGIDITHFISPYDYINILYANKVVRLYIVILPLLGLEQFFPPKVTIPLPYANPRNQAQMPQPVAAIHVDLDDEQSHALNTPDWVEISSLKWFELKSLKQKINHRLTLTAIEYFSYWLFCKLNQFQWKDVTLPAITDQSGSKDEQQGNKQQQNPDQQQDKTAEKQQQQQNDPETSNTNPDMNSTTTPGQTAREQHAAIMSAITFDRYLFRNVKQCVVDMTDKLLIVCDLVDAESSRYPKRIIPGLNMNPGVSSSTTNNPENNNDASAAANAEGLNNNDIATDGDEINPRAQRHLATFQKQVANGQRPHRFNTYNHIIKRFGYNRLNDLADFHKNRVNVRQISQPQPLSFIPNNVTSDNKDPLGNCSQSLKLPPLPALVYSTAQVNTSFLPSTPGNTVVIQPAGTPSANAAGQQTAGALNSNSSQAVIPTPSNNNNNNTLQQQQLGNTNNTNTQTTQSHQVIQRYPCDLSRCGRIIKRWLYNLTVKQEQFQIAVRDQKAQLLNNPGAIAQSLGGGAVGVGNNNNNNIELLDKYGNPKKTPGIINYWSRLAGETLDALSQLPCTQYYRQHLEQRFYHLQHMQHQHQLQFGSYPPPPPTMPGMMMMMGNNGNNMMMSNGNHNNNNMYHHHQHHGNNFNNNNNNNHGNMNPNNGMMNNNAVYNNNNNNNNRYNNYNNNNTNNVNIRNAGGYNNNNNTHIDNKHYMKNMNQQRNGGDNNNNIGFNQQQQQQQQMHNKRYNFTALSNEELNKTADELEALIEDGTTDADVEAELEAVKAELMGRMYGYNNNNNNNYRNNNNMNGPNHINNNPNNNNGMGNHNNNNNNGRGNNNNNNNNNRYNNYNQNNNMGGGVYTNGMFYPPGSIPPTQQQQQQGGNVNVDGTNNEGGQIQAQNIPQQGGNNMNNNNNTRRNNFGNNNNELNGNHNNNARYQGNNMNNGQFVDGNPRYNNNGQYYSNNNNNTYNNNNNNNDGARYPRNNQNTNNNNNNMITGNNTYHENVGPHNNNGPRQFNNNNNNNGNYYGNNNNNNRYNNNNNNNNNNNGMQYQNNNNNYNGNNMQQQQQQYSYLNNPNTYYPPGREPRHTQQQQQPQNDNGNNNNNNNPTNNQQQQQQQNESSEQNNNQSSSNNNNENAEKKD